MIRTRISICTILVAVCICYVDVQADMMLNLAGLGNDGFIDEAYFLQIDHSSTGTGVIAPFVRMQHSDKVTGVETGYNTTGTLEFQTKGGKWTHAIQLSDVPIVYLPDEYGVNTAYREFLLDINQDKSVNPSYLSLDTIEIYLDPLSNKSPYSGGLGTMVYNMDASGDNWILMDYALNAGSGAGDIFAYIPNLAFEGKNPSDYLYLYSEFGGSGNSTYPVAGNVANAGFEEWAVQKGADITVVPAPAAWLIGVLGLGVVGLKLRKLA